MPSANGHEAAPAPIEGIEHDLSAGDKRSADMAPAVTPQQFEILIDARARDASDK
jgi:hypothetical protein